MTDLKYAIETGSYSAFRASDDIHPVRISLGMPKWWSNVILPYCLELAPGRDYFKASWNAFNYHYRAQLDRHGVEGITQRLNDVGTYWGIPEGATMVLLCFETVPTWESDACHRALFRHWWKEQTGLVIPERTLAVVEPEDDPQEPLF